MNKLFLLFTLFLYSITVHAQQYPEMVKVEGGTFEMGDEWGIGDANEQTVHSVTLKTFSIAKTETTVAQWRTYCNTTGHSMPETPFWGWIDSHPIVNVTWDDAVAYCDWLSDKTGKIYRLPTEAEWEYAARGGKHSMGFKFSGSQSINSVGWHIGNSGSGTHPVAQKYRNELGLYDMSGNVWEWCQDLYGEYVVGAQTNPRGAKTGIGGYRVLRGASWSNSPSDCRVAKRGTLTPGARFINNGFRVVLPE